MRSGYFGIDLSQIIFAGAILIVFVGFAIWGLNTRQRLKKIEEALALRDFRELEPEGYEEEETTDPFSEGARLDADEESARQRDIREHSR